MKKVKRKSQFTYWLQNEAKDCGLMQPPLQAQKAIEFLIDYLLGEQWCIINPVNIEQCNTQAVHEILMKYSKNYRKEYRRVQRQAEKRRK